MNKVQVQDSSDCCIHSKFSSFKKGYFQDDHLSLFVSKLHSRSPIINRGYYIRFQAIDEVFQSWLSSVNLCTYHKFQIISLGAGYDSSYLRLKSKNKLPLGFHYIEIDFLDVMKKKYELIKDIFKSNKDVPLKQHPAIVLCTDEYSMLGTDLTDIPVLEKCLTLVGIEYDVPTLFLSECSITYIDPQRSEIFISWVQRHFPNSTFVAYEQAYPDDAFGLIMRNHFTEVGCTLKSIQKYPDEASQCERFKKLGWPDCFVITMYNLFTSLSYEEKLRIQRLEMFDEYEMWHEKCHHYILLWATQGVLSKSSSSLLAVRNAVTDIIPNPVMKKAVVWKYIPANDSVQRFGHQAIPLSFCIVMLSGGFGTIKKKHQRLGDIALYHVESKKYLNVCPEDKKLLMGQRMFHTMTKLSNNTIVIIGGRSSPKQIFEDILILKSYFSKSVADGGEILLENYCSPSVLETRNYPMPVPTWRHSASLIEIQGTEFIVVFGGCSRDRIATNNCYMVNAETWKWSSVNIQEHLPCPRHSHSAVTYKNNCVIVSGGLTQDEVILNSVHIINAESLEWTIMDITGLLPRYSHTSHIWKDHLLLIGGITSVANYKLGVGFVDLKTLQAHEVGLPAQDPEFPILLSNHSSYLQEDEIFIIGGGGNCFSFGTHFNKKIVSFCIAELVS